MLPSVLSISLSNSALEMTEYEHFKANSGVFNTEASLILLTPSDIADNAVGCYSPVQVNDVVMENQHLAIQLLVDDFKNFLMVFVHQLFIPYKTRPPCIAVIVIYAKLGNQLVVKSFTDLAIIYLSYVNRLF